MTIYSRLKTSLLISFLGALSGCSTFHSAPTAHSPTMQEMYQQGTATQGYSIEELRELMGTQVVDSPNESSRKNTISKKINQSFPLLPNPELLLYVYPHLAGNEEAPVPGYTTAFFLYDTPHFALPGEVPVRSESDDAP